MTDMYKLIEWGTNIVDKFFDSKLSADRQIAPELLKHARGIILLRELKAGFVWTGKVGGGIILSHRPDGSWSPPSALAQAGMGWGAELGGELTDFMIILGSDGAVDTFKRSGQISFGAGMDLAVGPYGRTAAANVTASVGGAGVNYTYSMSKGLFGGIGLRGDVLVAQGKCNQRFYGRTDELKPWMILEGQVDPPPGACDGLWTALARATGGQVHQAEEFGYDPRSSNRSSFTNRSSLTDKDLAPKIEQMVQTGIKRSWCEYALRKCDGNTEAAINYCFDNSERMDSLVASSGSNSMGSRSGSIRTSGSSFAPPPDAGNDPRLRRFKTEAEVWAQYQGNSAPAAAVASATPASAVPQSNGSSKSSSVPMAVATPAPVATAVPYPPSGNSQPIPPIPPPAAQSEQKEIYMRVIAFCKGWFAQDGQLTEFKGNCKQVGQGAITVDAFAQYLESVFSRAALLQLMPDLVRLMPTEEMRIALWNRVHLGSSV